MGIGLRLLIENGIFFLIATGFLAITAWAWRQVRPYELPKPLPGWFKYWFGSVQFLGIVPPLVALVWGVWQQAPLVRMTWTAYFILLMLQILFESLTLRRFHSVTWVMVPYLYLPYRLWQLYKGFVWTGGSDSLAWVHWLFGAEILIWGINYLLDLAQLPRLFQWNQGS